VVSAAVISKEFLVKRLVINGVLACVLLTAVGTVPARADIMFFANSPGSVQPDENLLFNDPSLTLTGLTVQGITNTTSTLFDITGLESLAAGGGQANVSGEDGTFTYMLLQPQSSTTSFGEFEANLTVYKKSGPTPTGTVTVTTTDTLGGVTTNQYTVGAGENFFSFLATDPDFLRSSEISSTVALADIQQIRVGGLTGPDVKSVPEPATLALFGAGLFGVASRLRRRRGPAQG
jgi:hypothetical protein